jgi:hypothetical protein
VSCGGFHPDLYAVRYDPSLSMPGRTNLFLRINVSYVQLGLTCEGFFSQYLGPINERMRRQEKPMFVLRIIVNSRNLLSGEKKT